MATTKMSCYKCGYPLPHQSSAGHAHCEAGIILAPVGDDGGVEFEKLLVAVQDGRVVRRIEEIS